MMKKIFNYYKGISNLPFINPEYIMDIYALIKTKSIEKNSFQFLKFLKFLKIESKYMIFNIHIFLIIIIIIIIII